MPLTAREIEDQLVAILHAAMEDTRVPEAIAAYADKRAGKPVSKTDATRLSEDLGIPVRIRRQYGMTHVAWTATKEEGVSDSDPACVLKALGSSLRTWGEHAILLAHSETNVHWPNSQELRSKEPAYFEARDDRNAARKELLSARHHLARAAAAIVKLREAQEEIAQLVNYGQPMHVVGADIENLGATNLK